MVFPVLKISRKARLFLNAALRFFNLVKMIAQQIIEADSKSSKVNLATQPASVMRLRVSVGLSV